MKPAKTVNRVILGISFLSHQKHLVRESANQTFATVPHAFLETASFFLKPEQINPQAFPLVFCEAKGHEKLCADLTKKINDLSTNLNMYADPKLIGGAIQVYASNLVLDFPKTGGGGH